MERIDIGDWCTLYHADSVKISDALREHTPDAVIMDPPYGIRAIRKRGETIAGDLAPVDLSPWWSAASVVLVWGADHFRSQLPAGGRFVVWDKLAGAQPWDGHSDAEMAWHSRPGPVSIISHLWKGGVMDARGEQAEARVHPWQKPLRVAEWSIGECRLDPGAVILDPYMGSGTTAIAAFKRKMKFVGVEIDRRWFDVAVERINRQTGDGPLFDEPAPDLRLAV